MSRESVIFDKYVPKFTKPVTMIVVAPRGSGKSVLLGDILYNNRDFFTDVYVFAGTDAVFNDYVHKIPARNLTRGYDEERLKQIVKASEEVTRGVNKSGSGKKYNVAIVLDDLGFDKALFRSKTHLELWMNSRHFGGSIFLTLQYVTSVPPNIRAQADVVVSLKESIRANQKKLHEFFFGVFANFSDFQNVLQKATENFGCLVVNNRAASSFITSCVFVYRADADGAAKRAGTAEDRLCSAEVWEAAYAAQLLRMYKKINAKKKAKEREDTVSAGGLVMDNLKVSAPSKQDAAPSLPPPETAATPARQPRATRAAAPAYDDEDESSDDEGRKYSLSEE